MSRVATRLTHRLVGTDSERSDERLFHDAPRSFRGNLDASVAGRVQGFRPDIAVTGGERLAIAEQPYVFGTRFDGESKFNAQIGVEFLELLLAKMTGDLVDPRFSSPSWAAWAWWCIWSRCGYRWYFCRTHFALAQNHRHPGGDDQQFSSQQ